MKPEDTHAAIGKLAMSLLDGFEEQTKAGAELIIDHVVIVAGFYGTDAEGDQCRGVVFRSDNPRHWSNRGILETAADMACNG